MTSLSFDHPQLFIICLQSRMCVQHHGSAPPIPTHVRTYLPTPHCTLRASFGLVEGRVTVNNHHQPQLPCRLVTCTGYSTQQLASMGSSAQPTLPHKGLATTYVKQGIVHKTVSYSTSSVRQRIGEVCGCVCVCVCV